MYKPSILKSVSFPSPADLAREAHERKMAEMNDVGT